MIVVGGEALVDLVPDTAVTAGSAVDALAPLVPRLGGGPFTTAVACGRLGAPTAFLSRISTDPFGAAMLDRLRESTVDTSLLARGDEPSSLAVVGLGADGAASYSFHVAGTADRLLADPGPLPARTGVLSLGTLGMVLEPGASAYEAVLRRESARGVLTVLDPNIRVELIDDPGAYRARFVSWLPDIRVLKVSEEDAAWLAGGDPDEAAAGWARGGPDAVVLTAGASGIRVFTASGLRVRQPAVRTSVADTIGAGDTVHAALLCRLHDAGVPAAELDERWWSHTARYAAVAASVTVSRPGADPPWQGELAGCDLRPS